MKRTVLESSIQVIVIAAFVACAYAFLHEGGHAIVGLLSGQRLDELNIDFLTLRAHVSMTGDLSDAASGLKSIAGPLVPVIPWLLFMLFVRKNAAFSLDFLKLMSAVMLSFSLFANVALAVLFGVGTIVPGQDIQYFLRSTRADGFLTAAGLFLVVLSIVLLYFLKAGSFLSDARASLRKPEYTSLAANGKPVVVMAVATVFLLATTAIVNASGSRVTPTPPPDAEELASFDLSERDLENSPVATFSVDSDRSVQLICTVENLNAKYLDVQLKGKNGFHGPILHGEDFTSGAYMCTVPFDLAAGEYEVIVSVRNSAGGMKILLAR